MLKNFMPMRLGFIFDETKCVGKTCVAMDSKIRAGKRSVYNLNIIRDNHSNPLTIRFGNVVYPLKIIRYYGTVDTTDLTPEREVEIEQDLRICGVK